MRIMILAALLGLSACHSTPAQQQQAIAAGSVAAVTLAEVAGKNNTTVQTLLNKGAAICGKASSVPGQLVQGTAVALLDSSGLPLSVVNQLPGDVSAACAGFGLVPGPAPAGSGVIPAVAVPAAKLPPVAA